MDRIGPAEPTLTDESYTGLFFGLASGLVFLLVHRWCIAGCRLAGSVAPRAGLLLVVAGTRLEPLRRDNPDFHLVGPGSRRPSSMPSSISWAVVSRSPTAAQADQPNPASNLTRSY